MPISETLLGLLLKGGWLMLPLLLLSLVATYIIVERLLMYRTYLTISTNRLKALEDYLDRGDISSIQELCCQGNNLIQKIIYKAVQMRKSPAKSVEMILQNESKKCLAFLEENLSLLATISSVAPMIGFLGTVTGMVQTFMAMAQGKNQVSAEIFSSGIYEAMITTVAGLSIGIVAYIGYNYLVARVHKFSGQLECIVNLFLATTVLK